MKRRTKENIQAILGLVVVVAVLGIAVSLWNLAWLWALRFAIVIGVTIFIGSLFENIAGA